MIKNYIRIAWRNIVRSKLYTVINIFCLSVGITGAILIALLLNHEFSYDKHHLNHPQIFRLEGHYTIGGSTDYLAITPSPLGLAMKDEFSGIKKYVRFRGQTDLHVKTDLHEFIESRFFYTDSLIFKVFTHHFLYGEPDGSLSKPHTVVLTESTSNRFFDTPNSIGNTIRVNNIPYLVTAVIADVPQNSHLKFDGLLSIVSLDNAYLIHLNSFWSVSMNYTYIQLHDNVDISSIENNMDDFYQKYILPSGNLIGASAEFTAAPLAQTRFKQIPFSPPTASRSSLLILLVVAVFLIVIAAVNYTNLATSRAGIRAREIGVRKVSGASRIQILWQFLTESLLLALFALLLSLLMVEILLPGFNTLAEKSFTVMDLFRNGMHFYALTITLITGTLAGVYPAFILSQMTPTSVLKSNNDNRSGPAALRKSLVVFQFAISIILIAGTITLQQQLNFLNNKELGLSTNNRMSLFLSDQLNNDKITQLEVLIKQNPMILRTTKSTSIPAGGFNTIAIQTEDHRGINEAKITNNVVDDQFIDFFEIELLEGRDFDPSLPTDWGNTAIINESAAKYLGWHENPLGNSIKWQYSIEGIPQKTLKVIGIMKDHNYQNLSNPITPFMIHLPDTSLNYFYISVEYHLGNSSDVRDFLVNTLREFDHGIIPNIHYPSSGYEESFVYQERLGKIFSVFAFVCILVSFLGLFGLSSFLSEQRKREVGIRKVLGATGWSILGLFYKQFAFLIAIAIIIAGPIYWWLLNRWLDGFVYRITLTPYPLLMAASLAILVMFATVSFHTVRAAALNPANSIKAN